MRGETRDGRQAGEKGAFIDLLAQAKRRFVTAGGRTDTALLSVVRWAKDTTVSEATLAKTLAVDAVQDGVPSQPQAGTAYVVDVGGHDGGATSAFAAQVNPRTWRAIERACQQAAVALSTTLKLPACLDCPQVAAVRQAWWRYAGEWGAAFPGTGQPGFRVISWATFLLAAPHVCGYGVGAQLWDDPRNGLSVLQFRDPLGITSITVLENLLRALKADASGSLPGADDHSDVRTRAADLLGQIKVRLDGFIERAKTDFSHAGLGPGVASVQAAARYLRRLGLGPDADRLEGQRQEWIQALTDYGLGRMAQNRPPQQRAVLEARFGPFPVPEEASEVEAERQATQQRYVIGLALDMAGLIGSLLDGVLRPTERRDDLGGRDGPAKKGLTSSRWTRKRTEREVDGYLSQRDPQYDRLIPLVLEGQAEAITEFRSAFGPTAIAKAIGDGCYRKAVENTPTYKEKIKPVLSGKTPKGWSPPATSESDFDDDISNMRRQAGGGE